MRRLGSLLTVDMRFVQKWLSRIVNITFRIRLTQKRMYYNIALIFETHARLCARTVIACLKTQDRMCVFIKWKSRTTSILEQALVILIPASANYSRVCETLEAQDLSCNRSSQPQLVSVHRLIASPHPAMLPHLNVHSSRPREMLASREHEARCAMTCGDPTFGSISHRSSSITKRPP